MPLTEGLPRPPFRARDRRLRDLFWVMEHVIGDRLTTALAGGVRRRVDQRLVDSLREPGALLPMPEVTSPDPAVFVREHVAAGVPCVMRGAAADWPCARKWTPGWFGERFEHEPIRLLHMAPDDVGKGRYDAVETTLGHAMAHLEEGNRSYCRFLPTIMEYPELQGDLDMAWLKARRGPLSPPGNVHLFIGGAGTETGTHTAVPANLFVQIHGTKRWKIFSPDWAPILRPPMERAMYFTSEFDPDNPDYERFPAARGLRGYEVELQPGDVMYIPPFWWHKVANPTVSIGIGFRWFPPHRCLQASPTMWLLTYLSINPPLWVGLQQKLDFTKIFTTRWS